MVTPATGTSFAIIAASPAEESGALKRLTRTPGWMIDKPLASAIGTAAMTLPRGALLKNSELSRLFEKIGAPSSTGVMTNSPAAALVSCATPE